MLTSKSLILNSLPNVIITLTSYMMLLIRGQTRRYYYYANKLHDFHERAIRWNYYMNKWCENLTVIIVYNVLNLFLFSQNYWPSTFRCKRSFAGKSLRCRQSVSSRRQRPKQSFTGRSLRCRQNILSRRQRPNLSFAVTVRHVLNTSK